MLNTPFSLSDGWAESKCAKCGAKIRKGDPRCVVMFAELGIGPGHRDYNPDDANSADPLDEDQGLRYNTAVAVCRPCAADAEGILIENPFFISPEQVAADTSGLSVRAIPASKLKVPGGGLGDDLAEDYAHVDGGKKTREDVRAPQRTEAEDRFLSENADRRIQPPLDEDDYRYRVGRFLLTPDASRLRSRERKVLELWSSGKKQMEIATETRISQATICRIIQNGKSLLYSRARKIA